jgi:hypothetical protein
MLDYADRNRSGLVPAAARSAASHAGSGSRGSHGRDGRRRSRP